MIAPGVRPPPEADEAETAAIRAGLARLRSGVPPAMDDATRRVAVLFTRHCLSCHTVDGVGGKDGPNLSKAGEKLDPGQIERRIIDPTEIQFDAEMPAFANKMTPEEIRAVAQWLGRRNDQGPGLSRPNGMMGEVSHRCIAVRAPVENFPISVFGRLRPVPCTFILVRLSNL